MQKLIDGMKHFQQNLLWQRRELFQRAAAGQRPAALLITCSDSRVLPETLLQADPGDLFVSRNAGNIVPPADAATGEAATIEYAVTSLGVTDLVVCGHYRCGAVRAIVWSDAASELPKTTEWLAHASETKTIVEKEHADLEGDALWDKAVECNVLVQVKNLATHPVVAAGLESGIIRLHAWVLRFETGEVLAFDAATDSFRPLTETQVGLAAPPSTLPPEEEPKRPSLTDNRTKWFDALKTDVPASFVVFMVALPLCLAIAKACGVPAEAGLITGIIGGMLVGLLAGSPLQVSGPAAGLIVILLDIVQGHGVGMLGIIVFLAGIIQLAAGALRLGQWFRAVSPAVILGMLAGIGAVVFSQQFHVMVDDQPSRIPLANLVSIPQAVWWGITDAHADHPEHREAACVGLLTFLTLLLWKRVAPERLRSLPAVLVAVVLATAVAALMPVPIQRVQFESLASAVRWIDFGNLPALLASASVWQAAVTIALVASAETLLCAAAVDQMHSGPRTRYDREMAAQGVGNAVCGLLGALPMTGVIVRSSANVQAGARTRWSAVLHGLWLLAFVMLMPGVLRLVPTAALAAILVLTGLRLIEIHAVRALWRESRIEAGICIATAVTVFAVDLLAGVMLGVCLSVAKLIYTFSRLRIRRRGGPALGEVTLVLSGTATFIRLPKLAAALEAIPPGAVLRVDFRALSYIDHACLNLFVNWKKQHETTGGRLILDWDALWSRFRTARPRPRVERQAAA